MDLLLKCNYTDIDQDIAIKFYACLSGHILCIFKNESGVYFLYCIGNYCNCLGVFTKKKIMQNMLVVAFNKIISFLLNKPLTFGTNIISGPDVF